MRLLRIALVNCLIAWAATASLVAQGDAGIIFKERKIQGLERLFDQYCAAAQDYAFIDRERSGDTIFVGSAGKTKGFRVGSLGKVVVAMGVLQLVEQGKLHLSDPVSKILPDLAIMNPWEQTDPIRLEHLLEHSSGLDEMHFCEYHGYGSEPISLAAALERYAGNWQVRWKPGTCNAYSNVNYAIAARVIEVVTGKEADVWLTNNVLGKMGMHDSYFDRQFANSDEIEVGRIDNERVEEHPYLYYPAASLVSTGHDMGLLMAFLLNGGQFAGDTVLQPASVQRMMRTESGPGGNRGWLDRDFGLECECP